MKTEEEINKIAEKVCGNNSATEYYKGWVKGFKYAQYQKNELSDKRKELIAFLKWENRTHEIPKHIMERMVDKYLESN